MRADQQRMERAAAPSATAGRPLRSGAFALALVALLGACASGKEPKLMHLSNDGKPDEFGILPSKPLSAPADYRSLPEPTPGGSNRTDPTPFADAVVAMGGRASALSAPQGSADNALLAHAGRMGTDPAIRGQLAAEDLDWRQRNTGRVLERLFRVNTYFKAYKTQQLDQHQELERLRSAGVKTPAAPPDPARN